MKPKSKSGRRKPANPTTRHTRSNGKGCNPSPSLNPITSRIAEVVERDLGEGWHPIAIIEARMSGKFCDTRCVHSKGAQEVIRTYFKEEVERDEESNGETESNDIPF